MKSNIKNWEVIEAKDFPSEDLIPVTLLRIETYGNIEKEHFLDVTLEVPEIFLKLKEMDQWKLLEDAQLYSDALSSKLNTAFPISKRSFDLLNMPLTLNIPSPNIQEIELLFFFGNAFSAFAPDTIFGLQEIIGVRFMKLIFKEDPKEQGGVECYIHAMNNLGEGHYIRIPWIDGLAYVLTHKNLPMYATIHLFLNNGLRSNCSDFYGMSVSYDIPLETSYREKIELAIRKDVNPEEYYVFSRAYIIIWGLEEEEIKECINLAIQLERYEWAKHLEDCLAKE